MIRKLFRYHEYSLASTSSPKISLIFGVTILWASTWGSLQMGKFTRVMFTRYRPEVTPLAPNLTHLESGDNGACTARVERVSHFGPGKQISNDVMAKHLIVDLQDLEADFLSTPDRFFTYTVQFLAGTGDISKETPTVKSCIPRHSFGQTCVITWPDKGRIILHAWPQEGLLYLDVLVASTSHDIKSIDSLGDRLQQHLRTTMNINVGTMKWSIVDRSPRYESSLDGRRRVESLMRLHHVSRSHIATMTTIDHQHVDIYDVRGRPRSGFKNSEHLNKYPNIEPLDRLVFRNGVLHDTLLGKAAFYEALVHPALFLHDSPKPVAILGGGNGATLREVLKHETIEHVVVVDVDGGFVDFSRQYLHEWSQCGDLHGSAAWSSCFEDRRVTLHFGGPIEWILEKNQAGIDRYDAIIIDSVYDAEPWTTSKHERDPLVALYELLSSDGIFVTDAEITRSGGRAATFFMNRLRMAGFENAVKYEEAHTRMGTPSSSFLLVMKSIDSRSVWYADESVWNLRIHQRSVRLHDGHLPFRYFDSGTMMGYQFPSKLEQEVWCKGKADHCNDLKPVFDPEIDNVAPSDLSVKPSLVAKGERGIFTEKHIPKGSYIALNECIDGFGVSPFASKLIHGDLSRYAPSDILPVFIDLYTWDDGFFGKTWFISNLGMMTFANHGCNGTENAGTPVRIEESSAVSHAVEQVGEIRFLYDPYAERNHGQGECWKDKALRDIRAGEELLWNYMAMYDDKALGIMELGAMCADGATGGVLLYENSKKISTIGDIALSKDVGKNS